MKTDTNLQHDVQAELEWDPSIDASKIGVTAKEGVVTLTGEVASYAAKMTAERVAKRVHGVKGVANDVEVRFPGSGKKTDADLVAAALSALRWDDNVPDDRIKVTVRDGWVSLDGTVDWEYQRAAAHRVVSHLTGVKGVTNDVKIKSLVKPGDVKDKIEAAFKRSAEVDAHQVRVEAEGSAVILSGSVHSWAERDEAEQAAWAAPGVCKVENRLVVTV